MAEIIARFIIGFIYLIAIMISCTAFLFTAYAFPVLFLILVILGVSYIIGFFVCE